MSTPRFSIVIPTRERAETLRYALRTCLAQDFDDYEVLVSDNFSSPATRQVVEEAASPKVRYVRSPRPLSMSRNWELGASEARGEYVTVLGDDDGMLGHALKELDRLVREAGAPVVRWTAAFYAWPSIALPGEAHYLRVPLNRELQLRDGHAAMAEVVRFEACYTTLPMISNAVVHRDVLARWRAATGTLFLNQYPDVYSGFALAHLAGTYASVDTPMTVAGSSGRSYGVATLFLRGKSALDHEFRTFNAEDRLLVHPQVPDLPVFPAVSVADSFQVAREAFFPEGGGARLDRKLLATYCVHGLRCDTAEDWGAAMGLIRASLADDRKLQAWFEATFGSHRWGPTGQFRLRAPYLGYDGDYLHLDADAFGVADVEAAVRLCEKVLNYKAEGIRYGLPARERLGGALAEACRKGACRQGEERRRVEAALRERAEDAEKHLGPLLAEVTNTHAALKEARGAIEALEGQVAQHRGRLQEAEARLAATDGEMAAAQAQIAELQRCLAAERALSAATDGEMAAAQAQIAELQRCLAAERALMGPFRGMGPTTVRIAHLLQGSSHRFPRLARGVKSVLRGTARLKRLVRPPRAA